MPGEVRRRAQPHQRGRGRHDGDIELAALDAIKGRQALGNQILVRRELVVGQRFPVGQQADAKLRREPRDLVEQALRIERGGGDDSDRRLALRETGDGERIGRADEPGITPAGGKRIAVHQRVTCVIISS
jgi:hypothetical protein